jgi:hypothetical protein
MIIYDYQMPGPSGLQPFAPPPLSPEEVIGRHVEEICPHVGTYGMGGPGFFGLRLGSDWLVIAVWGAGEWIVVQGRCVEDFFHHKYGRPRPWITAESDELSAQLIGQSVRSIDVRRHSLRIVFENEIDLAIEETSDHRPWHEGTKQPRRFSVDDDLRRAVFVAPTICIWVK